MEGARVLYLRTICWRIWKLARKYRTRALSMLFKCIWLKNTPKSVKIGPGPIGLAVCQSEVFILNYYLFLGARSQLF